MAQVSQMTQGSHSPTFHSIFEMIFNFFYHSHDMILIRLSNGNRMPTDFDTMLRFNFRHSTFVFLHRNGKSDDHRAHNRIANLSDHTFISLKTNVLYFKTR